MAAAVCPERLAACASRPSGREHRRPAFLRSRDREMPGSNASRPARPRSATRWRNPPCAMRRCRPSGPLICWAPGRCQTAKQGPSRRRAGVGRFAPGTRGRTRSRRRRISAAPWQDHLLARGRCRRLRKRRSRLGHDPGHASCDTGHDDEDRQPSARAHCSVSCAPTAQQCCR